MLPAGAYAQEGETTENRSASEGKLQRWMDMREEAVSAQEILEGNLRYGLSPGGQVANLVLNREGTAIEYIIYRFNHLPFSFYVDDGYVSYNAVDLETGAIGEIDVSMDADEPIRGPEEIEITADEADRRLVSRITDSTLKFKNGKSYEIEDLLVHPETGAIVAYIVGAEEGVLFSGERRAVPADEVRYSKGVFRTALDFAEVENMQRYDTAFL